MRMATKKHAIHQAAEKANNAQDMGSFLSLYQEDALMMSPAGDQICRGKHEIQRALESLFVFKGKSKNGHSTVWSGVISHF